MKKLLLALAAVLALTQYASAATFEDTSIYGTYKSVPLSDRELEIRDTGEISGLNGRGCEITLKTLKKINPHKITFDAVCEDTKADYVVHITMKIVDNVDGGPYLDISMKERSEKANVTRWHKQ